MPEKLELRVRRDPLRHVIGYGLVGGVAGTAVGAGFLGVMVGTGHGSLDWGSVLATGAGIGVAVGIFAGVMSAGGTPSPAVMPRPASDGLSFADQHRSDLSGTVMLPVFGNRF